MSFEIKWKEQIIDFLIENYFLKKYFILFYFVIWGNMFEKREF